MSFGLALGLPRNRVLAEALYLALASRDNMGGKHRSNTLLKREDTCDRLQGDAVAVAI